MFAFVRQLRADFSGGRRSLDPLLTAAQVLLYVLLAGVILAMVMTMVGLLTTIAAHGAELLRPPSFETWKPVSSLLLGLGALSMIFNAVLATLAIIRSVGEESAFTTANAVRLEKIAGNVLGLQILGLVSGWIGAPIGGDINGFDIGARLSPGGIAVVLLLFILARVFHQGASMRDDLEGTV